MRAARALAQATYLFSPLLVAVAFSAIVHRFDLARFSKVAIDGGRTFRGRRLFGDSKTWRGVAVAVLGCIAMVLLQKYALLDVARGLAMVDYTQVDAGVFGGTMGASAMAGELPNSFVKRQLGVAPGATASSRGLRALFWVWDQVDLLTLSWPAMCLWLTPSWDVIVASIALALGLHPLVAWIGYLIGARKTAR